MKISIIGLGLIGGSVARRLRGFKQSTIAAYDISEESLLSALRDGVIDEGYTDERKAVFGADLIIMCLYPRLNIEKIKNCIDVIKDGAIITDVSGVKQFMVDNMRELLPKTVDFIGAHPMAGREVGGYQSSTDTLFDGASFLITPMKENKPENIELIREMARYMGCSHVVTTSPEEHDAIIAYTSQLMHVVAIALCQNPMIERSTYFSAGSLRDCTRVAKINEVMWSELFVENKDELVKRIRETEESLDKMAAAIENSDEDALRKIMRDACEKKLKWLEEK